MTEEREGELAPKNQQRDVRCTACGWRGARHKVIDRPCPKCGGHVALLSPPARETAPSDSEMVAALEEIIAFKPPEDKDVDPYHAIAVFCRHRARAALSNRPATDGYRRNLQVQLDETHRNIARAEALNAARVKAEGERDEARYLLSIAETERARNQEIGAEWCERACAAEASRDAPVAALEKIIRRSDGAHSDDSHKDLCRDLFHINEIARTARDTALAETETKETGG